MTLRQAETRGLERAQAELAHSEDRGRVAIAGKDAGVVLRVHVAERCSLAVPLASLVEVQGHAQAM